MSVCSVDSELMHSRPLEWNTAEETATTAFFEPFISTSELRDGIFAVVDGCDAKWLFGCLEDWEEQARQMQVIKDKMVLLNQEILRLWYELGWQRWCGLSSGRRQALLLWALVDVEDMKEVNLSGRRQLCPELVPRELADNPATFVDLVFRVTAQVEGNTVFSSHPLVDAFLGLPRPIEWVYKNPTGTMYCQSILTTRCWYLTQFLVAALLRLVDRPLSTPFDPGECYTIRCLNPIALHYPTPVQSHCVRESQCQPTILDSSDVESLAHRFARCTGCMDVLTQTRVWCKRCPDVQYCTTACRDADWLEHCRTCGRKRRKSSPCESFGNMGV
jgi:hypothetical protein